MWFAKMFVAMVILTVVCFFAILNSAQTVDVTVAPGKAYYHVPLVVALFAAFVLGALVIFVFSLFRDIKARAGLSRLRRDKSRLLEELTALRTLPLDEPASGAGGGGAEERSEG